MSRNDNTIEDEQAVVLAPKQAGTLTMSGDMDVGNNATVVLTGATIRRVLIRKANGSEQVRLVIRADDITVTGTAP